MRGGLTLVSGVSYSSKCFECLDSLVQTPVDGSPDIPLLVFSGKEKTCLQPLQFQIQTEPLPTLPFPWTTLCLLCSTVSCSSFSPHGREDKPGGVCIPGPIQQRSQRRPSPSRPPPSLRQKSREGLRRVRPPCLVHRDHHSNGAVIGFSAQQSLCEPCTGCTQSCPRTRLPHTQAMQLLSK